MTDWIRAALSEEQQTAIDRDTENACILAGAGSGKTRTLVYLLLSDLHNGVPPENIICFTFTQKAAKELLSRIHSIATIHMPHSLDLSGMYVGTIHGWCLQYLMEHTKYHSFTPIDELQTDAIVSRLYDELGLQKCYGVSFPRGIDQFLVDIEIFYNEHLNRKQIPENIQSAINRFLDILDANHLMTFGGMIRYATEYLSENGPIKALSSLYIDEYQDVNPAQVALIKAMLPDKGKVVVVGDDLQCIYNWRGSDVTRILSFAEDFPDVTLRRLQTNYRSRPGIVRIANDISEHITLRDAKKVMLDHRKSCSSPAVVWFNSASEENQTSIVVDVVKKFLKNGIPPSAIAVLLRSVVGTGRPIVEALTANGIPVQCPLLHRGGEFIDQFILPIFQWLQQEYKEPKNEIEENNIEHIAATLWSGVRPWLPEGQNETDFWLMLDKWRRAISDNQNNAYDVRGQLYKLFNSSGLRVSPDDSDLMVGIGIASQIIRSVEEIHRRRLIGRERKSARGLMTECYFALIRNSINFGESLSLTEGIDAVVISTVHQAKGLEWPIVIIPNLVPRRFPVSPRKQMSSFPDAVSRRYGTSLDDERRLFFVAATRARERLILMDFKPHKRGLSFLAELSPDHLIKAHNTEVITQDIWSLSKDDLQDQESPPVRIGLSDLLIYMECPYQFGLRRVATIQPSVGDELGYGKGLHELIRRRLDHGKAWTSDEIRIQVEKYVFLPLVSDEMEKKHRRAILIRMEKLERIGAFAQNTQPEIVVDVSFGIGLVHGIIDCVQTTDNGEVFIRDWKSSIHEEFLPRYEKQLQFYAHALIHKKKNVLGADIVDIAESDKTDCLVKHEIDISPNRLNTLTVRIKEALFGIQTRKFYATPSASACSGCDMFYICGKRYPVEYTIK